MLKISEMKALARETLLGRYTTVIFAGIISSVITLLAFAAAAAALGFACFQGGLIGSAGAVHMWGIAAGAVVFTAFLAVGILLALFLGFGNTRLLLNLCRGRAYGIGDVFYGFRRGAHPFRIIATGILTGAITGVFSFFAQILVRFGLFLAGSGHAGMPLTAAVIAAALIIAVLGLFFSSSLMLADLFIIDEPGSGVMGALQKSMETMKGHRLKGIWLMWLSFIFWNLLAAACPIASLWIIPYISTTRIIFYLQARELIWQMPDPAHTQHAECPPAAAEKPEMTAEAAETEETSEPEAASESDAAPAEPETPAAAEQQVESEAVETTETADSCSENTDTGEF